MSDSLVMDESGIAWPDGPGFTYPGPDKARILGLAIGMGALGLIAGGAVCLIGGLLGWHLKNNSAWLGAVLIAAGAIDAALAFWTARLVSRAEPALSIDARGIFAFAGGRPWRFLAWHDIAAITRHRAPETIRIAGGGVTFAVSPRLNDYAEACRLLSRYARQYAIPLRALARGVATDIPEL